MPKDKTNNHIDQLAITISEVLDEGTKLTRFYTTFCLLFTLAGIVKKLDSPIINAEFDFLMDLANKIKNGEMTLTEASAYNKEHLGVDALGDGSNEFCQEIIKHLT